MPGAISGSTTRPSVARRPAPSICAASSTATGTSRTKPASSQSTSGSANDVSASTSASHVSRRSSARSSTKSGPTIVTWGNAVHATTPSRSEEHTSELQSQSNLVCRLLLEKKKKKTTNKNIKQANQDQVRLTA